MANGWDQLECLQLSPVLDFEWLDVMLLNKELVLEIEFSINRQKQDIEAAVDTDRDDFEAEEAVVETRAIFIYSKRRGVLIP